MTELRTIRIYPCFATESAETVRKMLGIDDETQFGVRFVVTENNCDYILASEMIYYNSDYEKKFRRVVRNNPSAIRIFRTGECVSPDFNIFDYAIVFDRDLLNDNRVCRIPFYRYFKDSLIVNQDSIDYKEKIQGNTKFCNFMYANPNAHPNRDKLFYCISEYKHVDSLGKHLNNTGVQSTRFDNNWRKISIELRQPYKFSIACENAKFKGYVSEKLISCLQAGTVAIYWGDPSVSEDFNTKAFINCNEYDSFDEVVERIKELDENDDLWLQVASAPWQTEEQVKRMEEDDKKYIKFLELIFSSKCTKQRGEGTFPDYYEKWFFERNENYLSISKVKKCVQKLLQKMRKMR